MDGREKEERIDERIERKQRLKRKKTSDGWVSKGN